MPLSAGDRVGPYEILAPLGAGGMGVVYRAIDTRLNRTVALKFLPPQIEADERARARFVQEARAASALDHPHVGAIYGIEETPQRTSFLVLAYYEGESLAQRLARGPVPKAQAVEIALQIARGLAEAHDHQIIHRDIKPSNIMLTRQGIVKIVDFGLARAIQNADSTASLHTSGTVAFMSPEQVMGQPLDQRTDLWSLGIVLLEMLTGHPPFVADTLPAVIFAIAHSPPAHIDEIPGDVQPIVYRALAKSPTERYQTAREMVEDLETVLGQAAPARTRTQTIAGARMKQYRASATRSLLAPAVRKRWGLAVAATLALAALLAISPLRRLLAPLAGPKEKHVAVLPFTVLGAGEGGELLGDGIMETLTSRLSNLEGADQSLWVVPASEVRRRNITDATAALHAFNATLAVTGAVQRGGRGVRMVVNLIDTRRMAQLGSDEVEDPGGNLSALEDAAVEKLARRMNVQLSPSLTATGQTPSGPAAFDLYLQARGLIGRFDKPGNLDQAISLLGRAVKTDASFALAYSSQAEAYLMKYKLDQSPHWLEQAAADGEQAVRISDRLAPIFVTLGRVHVQTGKTDLALEEFQHALDLDPRSADAQIGLASVYESQSRFADAERTLSGATTLRPDYWDGFTRLGLFYYRQRRFAEAVAAMQKAVELTPDNAIGWLNLGAALRGANRLDEAAAAINRSIRISPTYAGHNNLGNLYYQQGRFSDAGKQYRKALALNDKDYIPWMNLAHVDLWLDRAADAMADFRRAQPLLEQQAKLHPNDPVVQSKLGLVYVHLQDQAHGFSHLQAALALAPKDSEAMGALAEAYETLGDRRKAIAWLRKAISAGESRENIRRDATLHRVLEDPSFEPR